MLLLEVEPLDLGPDVRSIGLDLTEADETRAPARGGDAARVWSRVLRAAAGLEPWGLDFFSHLDRVRDFCVRHGVPFREATPKSAVIPAPEGMVLESLLERFETETFGARAGALFASGDASLEGELARHGLDAYHKAFGKYFFCAICGFEDGSLIFLSERLSTSEVVRRLRPALDGLDVDVRLAAQ